MANYKALKDAVKQVIKTNGKQEITGDILQNILIKFIDTFGDDFQVKGMILPSETPDTSGKCMYFANSVGTYPQCGGLAVAKGEFAAFLYDGQNWTKENVMDTSKFITSELASEYLITKEPTDIGFTLDEAISLVPEEFHKGGLTIKFKNTDGEFSIFYNKFDAWTTNTDYWVNLQSSKTPTMTLNELNSFPASVQEAIAFAKENKDKTHIAILDNRGFVVGLLRLFVSMGSYVLTEVLETHLAVRENNVQSSSGVNTPPRRYWRSYGLRDNGDLVTAGKWSPWRELVDKPFEKLQGRLERVVDIFNASPSGEKKTLEEVISYISNSSNDIDKSKTLFVSFIDRATNKRVSYYCTTATLSDNATDWVEVGKGGDIDGLVQEAKRKIQEAVDHAKTIKQGEKGEKGDTGWLGQVNHGTADTTFALTPNILHVWGVVPQLSITLAPQVPNIINEYMFEFQSPEDTPTNFNRPQNVKWANDYEQPIKANKRYQGSIVNNVMIIVEASV